MTNTTTLTHSVMPQTAVDALGHLVTRHGWAVQPVDSTLLQAHRFAHGNDGRPDLADADLDHIHDGWAAPQPARPARSHELWAWIGGFSALATVGFLMGMASKGVDGGQLVAILMITGFSFGAYFVPTIVAAARHHHNLGSVAVVNIFLGWTFVGWVVALAMAASAKK